MKKIFNFLKTLLWGILPAVMGGIIISGVCFIVKNIHEITVGSGWMVVLLFVFSLLELTYIIICLYQLGDMLIKSSEWAKYKKLQTTNNINGGDVEEGTTADNTTKK